MKKPLYESLYERLEVVDIWLKKHKSMLPPPQPKMPKHKHLYASGVLSPVAVSGYCTWIK